VSYVRRSGSLALTDGGSIKGSRRLVRVGCITELTSAKPDGIVAGSLTQMVSQAPADGMATPRGRKRANFRPAL